MNTVPARIYLDLDRTLFNTEAFVADLFAAAEQAFGIPAATLAAEIPKFYSLQQQDNLHHYDFFAQIAAHNINVTEADRVLGQALAGHDYAYPDAKHLVQFLAATPCEVQILSFGTHHYQTFKYRMAPSLGSLPITVVSHAKATYLAAQSPAPSLLVDDKSSASLPPWCTLYLLDRTAPQPIAKQARGVWRINSLGAVETALTMGYNEPNQQGTRHHEAD